MVTHLNAAAAASISSHRSCQSHDHTPQPPLLLQGHVTRRDVTYIPRLIRASVGASLRQRRDQSSFDNDQTASAALPYNNAHTQSAVGYFASAADAVYRFQPYDCVIIRFVDRFSTCSNSVNCHASTMWFMFCRWPQSREGDWAYRSDHTQIDVNSHRRSTGQNSFVDSNRTMSVRRYVIQITNASA